MYAVFFLFEREFKCIPVEIIFCFKPIHVSSLTLENQGHAHWQTTGKDESDTYRYFLSICNFDEEDGVLCPVTSHTKNIAACQLKDSDSAFGKSIGLMKKQKLR